MSSKDHREIFSQDTLDRIFPPQRADEFFEALFGEAAEGAYDIHLAYREHLPERNQLVFELRLSERPGKCLACNLTYGLPEVFSRHPIINIKGVAQQLVELLDDTFTCKEWKLEATESRSSQLHVIPLVITLG